MGDLPLRTPRHRRLGGPLPRQLANVTHAHPLPETLWPLGDAPMRRYAVLDGISPGYPPGAGRLHTRYSPVRRSPPASYPAALPLDLHVLSLSLAFILSQDQTLRCCLSFFLFFSDKKHRPFSPDRWLLLDEGFRPLCLSCLTVALFQCPSCSSEQSLRRLAGRPRFGVASAKVQQILLPTKLFYNFFVLNFHAFL